MTSLAFRWFGFGVEWCGNELRKGSDEQCRKGKGGWVFEGGIIQTSMTDDGCVR